MKNAVLCLGILLFSITIMSSTKDDLIVKRPQPRSQRVQQLREELAENLSTYLRTLTETLVVISERLLAPDLPYSTEEIKLTKDFISTLHEAQQFLQNNSLVAQNNVLNEHASDDGEKLYTYLVRAIAIVQQDLMKTLRCLLEQDATCHFVSCKIKAQFEKHIQKTDYLTKRAYKSNKYIGTIVQNVEKHSD